MMISAFTKPLLLTLVVSSLGALPGMAASIKKRDFSGQFIFSAQTGNYTGQYVTAYQGSTSLSFSTSAQDAQLFTYNQAQNRYNSASDPNAVLYGFSSLDFYAQLGQPDSTLQAAALSCTLADPSAQFSASTCQTIGGESLFYTCAGDPKIRVGLVTPPDCDKIDFLAISTTGSTSGQ